MLKRCKIVICDKSRLFREGLASILQQSKFRIHAVHSDFDEMLQKLPEAFDSLLFLIGEQSIAELDMAKIAQLKLDHPGCHIVLLINSASDEQRWKAAQYGVDGLLMKSISSEVLRLSLALVQMNESVFIVTSDASGEEGERRDDSANAELNGLASEDEGEPVAVELSTAVASRAFPGFVPTPGSGVMSSSRREGLSDRELDILDCLVNGHSNKVIARHCNITEATVKVHLKAILRKISVANRTQAAVWAINKMHSAMSQRSNDMGGDDTALLIEDDDEAGDVGDVHAAASVSLGAVSKVIMANGSASRFLHDGNITRRSE